MTAKWRAFDGILACILTLNATLWLSACSKPNAEAESAKAAKAYYDALRQGDYAAFVDATHRPDTIPESYRAQLITNAVTFAKIQQAEHRGIDSVSIARAETDSLGANADVFLLLHYGDSTVEQVVVPMIKVEDEWKMK